MPLTTPDRVWASKMDGAEHAALASVGFRPMGVVVAAVAFPTGVVGSVTSSRVILKSYPCAHKGFGGPGSAGHPGSFTYSRPGTQDAARKAFDHAYETVIEESRVLGAHGIVGITTSWTRLTRTPSAPYRLMMTGTAVGSAAPEPAVPFSTTMAAAELVQALLTGRAPVRIVGAFVCTSAFVGCAGRPAGSSSSGNSWSIQPLGDAVDLARSTAVTELSQLATLAGADEILGLRIERDNTLDHRRRTAAGQIYPVRAIGTATKTFDTGLGRVGARQLFRLRTTATSPVAAR